MKRTVLILFILSASFASDSINVRCLPISANNLTTGETIKTTNKNIVIDGRIATNDVTMGKLKYKYSKKKNINGELFNEYANSDKSRIFGISIKSKVEIIKNKNVNTYLSYFKMPDQNLQMIILCIEQ